LRRSASLNGCERTAKFSFPTCGEIDKNAEAAHVRNTFRSRSAKLGNNCNHFICDGIEFPGFSWDCDFGYAQGIWRRRERRCALDRFRDLLPHLGLKQRAVWIPTFMSEDEPETDADVYKHENHEGDAYADRHFAALRWNVGRRWQYNLARIAAHSGMNLSRHSELALQLLIRDQLLLQRSAFFR